MTTRRGLFGLLAGAWAATRFRPAFSAAPPVGPYVVAGTVTGAAGPITISGWSLFDMDGNHLAAGPIDANEEPGLVRSEFTGMREMKDGDILTFGLKYVPAA